VKFAAGHPRFPPLVKIDSRCDWGMPKMTSSKGGNIMKRSTIIAVVVAIATALSSQSRAAEAPQAQSQPAFSVQVSGEGQDMVLIPGLASSGEVWKSTVAHYSKHYRCHVLTLAGFAGSPAIQGDLVKEAEEGISRYIEQQHLHHPVIVGHSMGGFLALRLAADHPAQVGRLVIVDSLPALGATFIPNGTPEQIQTMAGQVRDNLEKNPASQTDEAIRKNVAGMATASQDVDRIVAWSKASDRRTVGEAMYDILATDLRPQLPQVKTPTLVLGTWIAYKDYAPEAAIEGTFKQQYAGLAGAKIEMAQTARHFIMYDDPTWMFERMDAFLQ